MNFQSSSLICLAIIYVTITTCRGQLLVDGTGTFKANAACSDPNMFPTQKEREQCTHDLCTKEPQQAFACEALGCKLKFPAAGTISKRNILKCVKQKCSSNPTHDVCQGIEDCEALKDLGNLGKAKYTICIVKLFPKE